MRKIEQIGISAADRERLVRDRNTLQKMVWRARIVLLVSGGLTAEGGIAAAMDKGLLTVRRWRRRYAANATHWSLRTAAARVSSVQRIWRAHGLKPHLVETFKVSRDKNFAAKVEDVVGLYLDPPDRALVFCVDEKSQIQALDRTHRDCP